MGDELETTGGSTTTDEQSLWHDLRRSLVNNWILWIWAAAGFAGLYAVSQVSSAVIEGLFYEVLFGVIGVAALVFALKPVLEQQGILG